MIHGVFVLELLLVPYCCIAAQYASLKLSCSDLLNHESMAFLSSMLVKRVELKSMFKASYVASHDTIFISEFLSEEKSGNTASVLFRHPALEYSVLYSVTRVVFKPCSNYVLYVVRRLISLCHGLARVKTKIMHLQSSQYSMLRQLAYNVHCTYMLSRYDFANKETLYTPLVHYTHRQQNNVEWKADIDQDPAKSFDVSQAVLSSASSRILSPTFLQTAGNSLPITATSDVV